MKVISILALLALNSNLFAKEFDSKHLLIKLKVGEKASDLKSIFISKVQKIDGPFFRVTTSNLEAAYNQLQMEPSVEIVERDYTAGKRKLEIPNYYVATENEGGDPLQGAFTPSLRFEKGGVDVQGARTLMAGHEKQELIVAVVDTGVDINHPDLKNKIWTNKKEIPGNNIDDDKNGYVDDVHGINTLVRDNEGKATGNIMASHPHGTHVSGIIAAEGGNGIGIEGVSTHAKIMAIRTVPDDGDELDSDVVESFLYAAKNGAKIINCSFGKAHNEGGKIVPEVLTYIHKQYGTLVVVAAGNNHSNTDLLRNKHVPSVFTNRNLLSVSATKDNGALANFSNYGFFSTDVAAPGDEIISTVNGGKYASFSGTSMAAPVISGMAAELWSLNPTLSNLQVKRLIMKSSRASLKLLMKNRSSGRADLKRAVERLLKSP